MQTSFSTIKRLWHKSPRMLFAYLYRKVTRKAHQMLPKDEWNGNWLGEEMRPFNSMRSTQK
ncbi:MAG: hypothetical protein ACOYNO_09580 [Saprospiraceae bacterium]